MVEAKFLLPFVVAGVAAYVIDNARRIEALKQGEAPQERRRFFAGKVKKQFLAVFLVPATALLLSMTLNQALEPGTSLAGLAARITKATGISARDLWALFSPGQVGEVILAIVMLEGLPIVLRSKSHILMGDVSILLPRTGRELFAGALLAITAGVGEELLFRGFIPLALANMKVPYEAALAISVLVFAACHFYQGPLGVLATGAAGAFLTGAYILTGSLAFVMAIHVSIDVVGLVVRPVVGLVLRRLLVEKSVVRPPRPPMDATSP